MKKILLTGVALSAMSATAAQAIPTLQATGGFNGNTYEVYLGSLEDFPDNLWTYDQANAFATGNGGFLATIKSQPEQDFIKGLVDSTGASSLASFWLGGSDSATEGDWIWTADGSNEKFWEGGKSGTPFGYENWGSIEPNDVGTEDHMALNAKYGSWLDIGANIPLAGAIVEYVPEPAALGLIGLGLLGLGAAANRRRKAA